MNKAYHITEWDTMYETCETRKIRTLTFYAKPNKLIGEGIGSTLQEPDGLTLLGTWSLLVDLASLSARDHRGWLIRNGTALTAARMGALLRVPGHHFERALDWFSRPEINWLELKETKLAAADSPAIVPPSRNTSADSPAIVPQEEGKREGEREEKEREERDALTLAAARASAPSPKEVEGWAQSVDIPPAFALEKLREALEREDFTKPSVRKNWQARFARFWETDAPAWRKKMQKNAASQNVPVAGHPDGWKTGDQDFWWTDELPAVRATMAGAAHSDKKTAARISEIIKLREKH